MGFEQRIEGSEGFCYVHIWGEECSLEAGAASVKARAYRACRWNSKETEEESMESKNEQKRLEKQ